MSSRISFRRLRWLILAGPLLIIGVLEYSRWALDGWLPTFTGRLLMDGVVLVGAVCFYAAVSTVVSDLLDRLERQNRELKALRSASLDITADLALESVLQRIVDHSRGLLGCRYGALAVYSENERLQSFVFSGIEPEVEDLIGDPPSGRGLLQLPLREGHSLRLSELSSHRLSAGFPANHPPMSTLLAVPVICHEPFRGNLYLSEKLDGSEFSADDELTLQRFATQAAIAVDNAQLHAKVAALAVVTERLRLAREMHDGQAQVLAYVNTKAQVVDQLMAKGEIDSAREHLDQMAAAAREVYADVREGILGLRNAVEHDHAHDLARVLGDYAERWQDQCGIPVTLEIEGDARYGIETELQVVRVLQEALANVRKHSQADRVFLRAKLDRSRLIAEVEDDGVGFELEPAACDESAALQRFGLATMRERCAEIGAELSIRSTPGQGTRIRLELSSPTPTARRSES